MIHYHFGSKYLLWKAAIDRLMFDLEARFPTNRDELQDLDPVSRLKVLTRRFILMSAADPDFSRIVIHEGLSRSERLTWLVNRYLKRGLKGFDRILQAGMDEGAIKKLPLFAMTNTLVSASAFTFCLAAMVDQVYRVDLTKAHAINEMADTIIDMLFNGILHRDK